MALLQVEKLVHLHTSHSPSHIVLPYTCTWGHARAFPPGPLPNKDAGLPCRPILRPAQLAISTCTLLLGPRESLL